MSDLTTNARKKLLKALDPDLSDVHDEANCYLMASVRISRQQAQIESLQQFRHDAKVENAELHAKIESLQMENAALRDLLDRRGNLSKYADSGNLQIEQEAAITPEMRERIQKLILPKTRDKYWDSYSSSWTAQANRLLRDLLGEQG